MQLAYPPSVLRGTTDVHISYSQAVVPISSFSLFFLVSWFFFFLGLEGSLSLDPSLRPARGGSAQTEITEGYFYTCRRSLTVMRRGLAVPRLQPPCPCFSSVDNAVAGK